MTTPPPQTLQTAPAARQYDALTPQHVLDALDTVGLRGDGRILQLNSYENRVFQVFLEDGRAVVAKFYRPGAGATRKSLKSTASRSSWQRLRSPWCHPWS